MYGQRHPTKPSIYKKLKVGGSGEVILHVTRLEYQIAIVVGVLFSL